MKIKEEKLKALKKHLAEELDLELKILRSDQAYYSHCLDIINKRIIELNRLLEEETCEQEKN